MPAAENYLLKGDLQLNLNVAALSGMPLAGPSAKPKPAEHIFKNIGKIKIAAAKLLAKTPRPLKAALMPAPAFKYRPELVVLGALGIIRKYLVGLVYFLELGLVAAGFVGMELVRQAPIGLLNVVLGSVPGNTENLVVVAGHSW